MPLFPRNWDHEPADFILSEEYARSLAANSVLLVLFNMSSASLAESSASESLSLITIYASRSVIVFLFVLSILILNSLISFFNLLASLTDYTFDRFFDNNNNVEYPIFAPKQ